jgi:hypothetical protein
MNTQASPPAEAASSQKLAEQIYVELLGRAFLRVDNAAVIKPEPADLARLSLQLAHAFREVERKIASDAGPKNVGYDLKSADWIK